MNFMGVDQFGNPAYVILRLSDSRTAISNGAFSQAGDSPTTDSMVSACTYTCDNARIWNMQLFGLCQ